jgi:hypothetical protein
MAVQGSDEIAKAAIAASDRIPDLLEKSLMWLTGLAAAFGIGKGIVRQGSKATTEFMVDQTVRDQISILRGTIHDQAARMEKMGKKLGELRDIELEGSGDLAIVGVWVETLEARKCPCMATDTCCATTPTEKLSEAYKRMKTRREKKDAVFAENETVHATDG